MNRVLRCLLLIVAVVVLHGCDGSRRSEPAVQQATDTPPATDPRVAWLREHAVPVTSIASTADDFTDLRPLQQMIGDARVVLLGEQTHGDGATFRAKVRLIKFLHQEMGFDVLAWESGLYDVRKSWELMRGGEAAIPALRQGVSSLWTASEQVGPLFDYVDAQMRGPRPLEMAGFDSQFTGSASHTYLVADLMRFLEEIGSPLVQAEEWASYQSHLIRVLEATDQSAKPAQHERDRFHEMTKRIVAEAQAARHRDASFWSQMAESISAYATDLWMERSFTSPRMNNSRDAQMARNLLWLINHQYRGRKIIVWAATFHAVRDIQGVRPSPGLGLPPDLYDGVVVTGHHLHQALGNQMFVLGFIAHSGQYGRFYEAPKPLAPPPPDSLEALLHNAGFEHAILDLRSSSSPGDWLRSSFVSRPLGYAPMEARWSRVMDAVFYSRTMTPSTRAP